MDIYVSEIELLRSFYYTASLPVRLVSPAGVSYSLPEKISAAAEICGCAELAVVPSEDTLGLQYVRSEAFENFIFLALPDGNTVSVGPFLTESVSNNAVTTLIREKKINSRCRTELADYFAALPIVSEQRYFYCGKLLEALFSKVDADSAKASPPQEEATFIGSEYYSQANDYRMQQFSHSPYAVEQEICRTISNGDTLRAKSILGEINRRPRARLAGTAVRSLKNSIICSCTFMARAAITGGVSPDDAFTLSDTYIQRIEECSEIGSLLKFEDSMISGYTAAVNSVRKNKYSAAVYQALSYIDAHLCEPITVSQIAKAVYLNPNYLSGIFSDETGETIHSCITRRRIEEAAFYVRNSSESLAEIAAFYQFSSQSHFVQSFKRVMGVTPGLYRREGAAVGTESGRGTLQERQIYSCEERNKRLK